MHGILQTNLESVQIRYWNWLSVSNTQSYFTFWVAIAFIWGHVAFVITGNIYNVYVRNYKYECQHTYIYVHSYICDSELSVCWRAAQNMCICAVLFPIYEFVTDKPEVAEEGLNNVKPVYLITQLALHAPA